MNNVDIFSSTKEKTVATWVKFLKAGDSVQGTYVGKITGSRDGFGGEQVIYQILKDGEVVNVGFGINKKVIIQEMEKAKFGQIVGFKYKGKLSIKNKVGVMVEVKDFGLYLDPKLVDTEWLKENAGCMPETAHVKTNFSKETENANQEFSNFGVNESSPVPSNDVPASITSEDKLAIIAKLAHDKLGVTDATLVKDQVMTVTGIAFLPTHYDIIISALKSIGQ